MKHAEAKKIEQEIDEHSKRARRGEEQPPRGRCGACGKEGGTFKRHGVRPRVFKLTVENLVKKVSGWLTRWKHSSCGRTFTAYPWFALAGKHYVTPEVMNRSGGYVQDGRRGYRTWVMEKGREIFHPDPGLRQEGDNDELVRPVSTLAHSTLYRWVTTLGKMRQTVKTALDLIEQKNPATGIFRELSQLKVSPGKYNKNKRERILRVCLNLVVVDKEYRQLFGVPVLPALAPRPRRARAP